MRFVWTLVFAATMLSGAACGDDRPRNVREWTAEDHLQPTQPDPARQGQSTGTPNEGAPEATPDQIREAAAGLFRATCGGCHGAGGAGDGAEAPVPNMPDFTSGAWQAAASDADIARAIRMGQGLMPAYGSQLNERGIAALVAHIRRLGPEGGAPEGGAPEGGAPEGGAPEGEAPVEAEGE